jgi:hypothetical protein
MWDVLWQGRPVMVARCETPRWENGSMVGMNDPASLHCFAATLNSPSLQEAISGMPP